MDSFLDSIEQCSPVSIEELRKASSSDQNKESLCEPFVAKELQIDYHIYHLSFVYKGLFMGITTNIALSPFSLY